MLKLLKSFLELNELIISSCAYIEESLLFWSTNIELFFYPFVAYSKTFAQQSYLLFEKVMLFIDHLDVSIDLVNIGSHDIRSPRVTLHDFKVPENQIDAIRSANLVLLPGLRCLH